MNLTDQISKYCTYGEAIRSDTAARLGIANTPNDEQIAAMRYVATEVFDAVREHFGVPLFVSSFFRSPELNVATLGASRTSQHQRGEAIDMVIIGRCAEIFNWIKNNLEFDQLIWEFGSDVEPAWVHCSKVNYRQNKKEVLKAYHDSEGNIKYSLF